MIVLEDLNPILQPLLEGREDAADVIESVMAIDKDIETPDNSEEIAKINEEWNQRFKEAFFGPKGEKLEGTPPEVPEAPEDEGVTGENITIDDLFNEKIIE